MATPSPQAVAAHRLETGAASAPALQFAPLTVVMDAPLLAVAAAVTDHANAHLWLANCVHSEVLEQGPPALVYQRTRVGPLCDDRDVVIAAHLDVVTTDAAAGGRALRSWVHEQDCGHHPPPRHCIRMQHVRGEIFLLPLPDGRTEVTYRDVEVRVGGWIPDRIARMAARTYAKKSFAALQARVGLPLYAAAAEQLGARVRW